MKNKIKSFNLVLLVVAGLINATGVTLFLLPASVLDGGISGLSVLLSLLTGLPIAIYVAGLNLPFFLVGLKKYGFRFICYSLVAIFSYALFSFLYEIMGLSELMYSLVKEDIFLCSIFGGLISGIGSGLTIRFGGAIDGIEVLSVSYAKKISLTVGQFVMIFNAIMYLVACFITEDFQIGLYSIVSYTIGLKAVDFVIEGFDKAKGCFIITTKAKEIAKVISDEMGRGITLIQSQGYFSGEDKTMMYCVVNRFEINALKTIVNEIDEFAFVTISDISEVVGTKIKYSLSRRKVKDKENE